VVGSLELATILILSSRFVFDRLMRFFAEVIQFIATHMNERKSYGMGDFTPRFFEN
jgi:hypothetical protein